MWWLFLSLILTVVSSCPILEGTTPSEDPEKTTEILHRNADNFNAYGYLEKYGYLPHMTSTDEGFDEQKKEAVELFQTYFGLKVTGELDEETLLEMKLPRCGVKDIEIKRQYRGKWNKRNLTYKFLNYATTFNESMNRRALADAFKQWEEVTHLKFTRVERGPSDMKIIFEEVDGMGGIRGMAPFPDSYMSGQLIFDIEEHYIYHDYNGYGTDLQALAMHEIGHSLGLTHAFEQDSVMFPVYRRTLTLGKTDIARIQILYPPKY